MIWYEYEPRFYKKTADTNEEIKNDQFIRKLYGL